MEKVKVAFVCTHNACRSQIAEALGRKFAGDVFESCSAGTDISGEIDAGALRLVRAMYGIDMKKEGQFPKTLRHIPEPDYVITMGCGVKCPYIPAKMREDWGLEDPSGGPDEQYIAVIRQIEGKIKDLRKQLLQ